MKGKTNKEQVAIVNGPMRDSRGGHENHNDREANESV